MANIVLLGVRFEHTRGGAEALIASLKSELEKRGHSAFTVELPMNFLPKEGIPNYAALWRSLDLTSYGAQDVDLVIATKFPTYYIKHPRKSVWLIHQHRQLYDLYGTSFTDFTDDPRDDVLREMLVSGDTCVLGEADYLSGISANVVNRLQQQNGLEAEVLYPPLPLGDRYYHSAPENYILSVGRLCRIKRVELLIQALPFIDPAIKLKIVGLPDEDDIAETYQNLINEHRLGERVEFCGRVSDEELLDLYSRAAAVYYAPYNEDYGYVTLEAFASSKPVITARDSGGVLEFVRDGKNGLVLPPDSQALGQGIHALLAEPARAQQMGLEGRRYIEDSGLLKQQWDRVLERLLSPLESAEQTAMRA